MTRSPETVTKAELHGFVDGELDEARRDEVAAYLARHPEAAARVAAYEEQNAALHAMFDPLLDESDPAAPPPPAAGRRITRLVGAVAAAIALLLVGGVAGWTIGAGRGAADAAVPVARHAVVAHEIFGPEVAHPVDVTADQEGHLLAWLSWRLGVALKLPRLDEVGYSLIGGRLLAGPDGPAAQFLYEDERGYRLTLYVAAYPEGDGAAELRYAEAKGGQVFYWVDVRLGYALTAKVDLTTLRRVARAAFEQLKS